ncbi:MAG: hypothetical protein J1F23_07600 [Oscillospiraceae bacterium]|nr:hypothetical protein [Oscillospiraceae bacterium]
MEKKIIAIVGVVILLVSVFAACAKKPTIIGNNGMEYAVVTDKEGNTVANDNGDIAVYVTDEHGKYVKDSNGEKQTNYIEFPDSIINGNSVESADYVFSMPEGWTPNEAGRFIKDNTDETVSIVVKYLCKLENLQTLATVVNSEAAGNEDLMEAIKKEYPDSSMTISDVEITSKNAPAKVLEFLINDDSGNVLYHAHGTYYLCNGEVYKVEYICNDGNYNDTAEELLALINEGLTIKGAAG